MRKALTAALILVLTAAASAGLGQQKALDPLERLARLYEESRYFELRDAVARMKDHSSLEMEFFRGAVDEVFNRLDSAVSRLQNYVHSAEKGPARMMTKEAWVLLADAFRRSGRYREAAEARREILDRFGSVLVLPDEFFPSAAARFGVDRRGLLGAPVLEGFKEITETKDGDLIIPASPRPRSEQNMCFSGFMPVVQVLFRGARLSLCLDTGSSATYLYPPFFRRYRGEIVSRSKPRKSTMGGVGSSVTVPIHVLDEFGFRAGGKDLSLRKIAVHTEVTHTDTRYFHGTLGLDILAQCSRMTLNFESMSFILE